MARIRSSVIEGRTARLKLPVARKPVFVKVGPRVGLGYRRTQTAGTWVVRVADGKGGYWTKALGIADDFDQPNGNTIMDFWQAQNSARALARSSLTGSADDDGKPVTVAQALARYKADLETRGGDLHNVSRVLQAQDGAEGRRQRGRRGVAQLPATLANKAVALLTAGDLSKWRDGLKAKKLAPSTVNRTATVLKAALNLAADHDEHISNRQAWEKGLATIPDAEDARNVILPDDVVRSIITGAYGDSPEFGLLVEVAALTGARVSQLRRLKVEDVQGDRADVRLMMPTSRKGRGHKKSTHRPVPIPESLVTRLRPVIDGKLGNAALLVKPGGAPWQRSDHTRLFKRVAKNVFKKMAKDAGLEPDVAKNAGLDPEEVTIYALRHSSIVRQILAGVPIRVVAVNHDTSVQVIERNYSKFIGDHSDGLARAALLDVAPAPPADNVVPNQEDMRFPAIQPE
jgi:integrase